VLKGMKRESRSQRAMAYGARLSYNTVRRIQGGWSSKLSARDV
jgi:hypothetical protein